jgi:hypothetical protein
MPASQHEQDANGVGVANEIAWCEFFEFRNDSPCPRVVLTRLTDGTRKLLFPQCCCDVPYVTLLADDLLAALEADTAAGGEAI